MLRHVFHRAVDVRVRVAYLFLLLLAVVYVQPAPVHADRVAHARYNQLLRCTAMTAVPEGEMTYYGTAWVVDKKRGWLMTAYHCTAGKKTVQIYYPKYHNDRIITQLPAYGRYRPATAKVIATDEHRDLALLQVNSIPSYFESLKIAHAPPAAGETVFTLGNPVGTGKVFQFRRAEVIRFGFSAVDARNTGMTVVGEFLTVQGDVISGFSGGAMINARGEVVGVAAAGLNDTQNVGYIGHTELRKFFGLDDRYTRVADPEQPMVGDWIVTVYENGERKGQGAFTFSEDGRYTMSKLVEHQRGRYAHLNDNRLIMRAEGYEVEQMQVEWDGLHRFVTTSGKQKFVFDRYGTLQMETNS